MRNFIFWTFLIIIFLPSCKKKTIGGNGIVTEKLYKVEGFHSLSLKGAFEVHLLPSDSYMVKIIADSNLIPEIAIEVNDSILEVYPQKNIIRSKELKLYIASSNIKYISLSGASEVVCDTSLTLSNLTLSISGTGKISLRTFINTLNINISGGAEIVLKGEGKNLSSSITGVGRIDAQYFPVENANIEISGYGHTIVNASNQLNINISGYGKIFYLGDPIIKQNITGSAKIRQNHLK